MCLESRKNCMGSSDALQNEAIPLPRVRVAKHLVGFSLHVTIDTGRDLGKNIVSPRRTAATIIGQNILEASC